jgi:Fe-S oxidoreductase
LEVEFELNKFFDLEKCTRCGKCLMECPVLRYPEAKAMAEKEKLIKGEPSEVLELCKSCFSCDRFCPNDCNPYFLILYRWFQRYQEKGIPVRALKSLPVEDKNFLYYTRKVYNRKEKGLVAEWEKNTTSDLSGQEVIFAGCNAQIFPYLFESPLLAGPRVMGRPGLCCGEVYFRMGLFDRVTELGKTLTECYEKTRPGRVIMFCLAGYNMQKNILPKRFGFKLKPEIIYLGDWLLERVKKGEIKFTRPLKRKVVVQESCHAKVLGDDFMEKPRELLRMAGAEVVEMNPCRERQVCCGVADGITHFNPLDMTLGGVRQWRLAKKTGADIFVAYCATCYLMLKMAGKAYPSFMPCLHLLEVLTYAAGYPVSSLADKRAGKVMARVVAGSVGNVLSTKRVFPKK